jgi:hypothetical protein
MKLLNLFPVLALAAFGTFGCGGDDDGGDTGGQKGTVNEGAAKSMASSTVTAVNAAASNNGMNITSSVQAAGAQAQSIITPAAGGQPQSALGKVAEALAAGDCSCDDAAMKCVFDKCTSGTTEINGEISWTSGSLKCVGLTYTTTAPAGTPGTDTTIKTDCDLTFTATEMNGTLNTSIKAAIAAGGQNVSYDSTANVTFNTVTYGAGGPTGGSITVKGNTSVTSGGQTQKYTGNATVNFP